MFNICLACGHESVSKAIVPVSEDEADAICPQCAAPFRFRRLPLFVITGASGAGKSTVGLRLMKSLTTHVVLDMDVLWRPEFDTPADGYAAFRDTWLRLAKNIHQGGRSVVLLGSVIPEQIEHRPERRYFADVYYLALTAEPDVLVARLLQRPVWRDSGDEATLVTMVAFNTWLRTHADRTVPPMACLDTTRSTVDETANLVRAWISEPSRGWPPGPSSAP